MKIVNAEKDYGGNSRKNIFLAMEGKEILGRGYLYPNLNEEISMERPMNIYMDLECLKKERKTEIYETLLPPMKKRANEIAKEKPAYRAWLYSGTLESDDDKLDFLEDRGFNIKAFMYKMRCSTSDLRNNLSGILVDGTFFEETTNAEYVKEFIHYHNDIFLNATDDSFFEDMKKEQHPKYISLRVGNELIGNIVLFIKECDGYKVGYIENLFTSKEHRRKGASKALIERSIDYFEKLGVDIIELETWSQNKRAVKLYKSLGFDVFENTEFYRGVEI